MEAAIAAVTAEFAGGSVRPRGGRGSRSGRGGSRQTASQGYVHEEGLRAGRGGIRGTRKGRGSNASRHGSRQSTSASASENEAVLELLPAATAHNEDATTSSRGSRYRSQLSEANGSLPDIRQSIGSSSLAKSSGPTQEELAALSYRERLTLQLDTSSIECPICYNTINRKQPISSCRICFAPYHLRCIKDWADRSIVGMKEKASLQQPGIQVRASWRCPSCQTQSSELETPRYYYCFCGRTKDPTAGGLGHAHSCDRPCKRERPEGCNHSCHLLCHPVNCDPCNVMLQMQCHCGREQKSLLCGSFYTTSGTAQKLDIDRFLRCEQICGRMSSCGLHACERQCHTGDCEDCGLLREKTCYCGKHSKNSPCGGAVQAKARQLCHSSGKKVSWQGEYSCGQPCPWKYDCGTHSEAMTNAMICHPHSSSDPIECPRSPSLVSSCPCGQTTLSEISSIPRTSCSDSIPSCGKVCSKITPQCGHVCDQVCHEGPCGQCEEIMKLVCRCGNEKRSIKCAYLQAQGEAELLCEKHCKALRNCGRHECGRKCCPLAFQEVNQKQRRRGLNGLEEEDPMGFHQCDRLCNRVLNCGQHRCQLPDHRGACQPCLRSSFEELTCHCGSTTLIPPVPCSTRIVCNQSCARPDPPCGHPKAPHTCHEDDQSCPPCPFLTSRECQCYRHQEVKNVRCSQTNISCGRPCDGLLACGYHRCKKLCHPADECQECLQTCGKSRLYCGHPCQQKCHAPSRCPVEEPCLELVEATCPCGHVKQRTRCGACQSKPESNGGLKLSCNQSCAVALRNASLAEAFGLSKDRQAGSSQHTSWLAKTIQYYGENLAWGKSIEQIFIDFEGSSKATYMFPAMKHPQRRYVHEVAEKFKMRSESLDEEPFRSVLVARKAESTVPKPLLSGVWAQQYKINHPTIVPGKKAILTQAAPPAPMPSKQEVNSLYLEACFGYDEEALREVLAPYMLGMAFKLHWTSDEDVACVPKSTLSPSELTLKLRLIRNSVRNKITSCKAVDAAYFEIATEAITFRDHQWTSVSSSSAAPPNPWTQRTSILNDRNPFSTEASLSINNAQGSSRQVGPALTQPSGDIGIVANGLHRPPSAVIVAGHADLEDNWDDKL